jgi:hypothetical protein
VGEPVLDPGWLPSYLAYSLLRSTSSAISLLGCWECWDILVSWGWKFLVAVMGVGVEVPIGRLGNRSLVGGPSCGFLREGSS